MNDPASIPEKEGKQFNLGESIETHLGDLNSIEMQETQDTINTARIPKSTSLPSVRMSWHGSSGGEDNLEMLSRPASARSDKRSSQHIAPPSSFHLPSMRGSQFNFLPSEDTLHLPFSTPDAINPADRSVKQSPSDDPFMSEADLPKGLRLLMVLVALNLSIFLIALDNTIVATAIPSITNEFHGLQDVAWYSAVFFMTAGGFQSTWGKLYKFFALKPSYLTAIFIFELGSLICGVAPSSASFIVGRAIAGVGAAGVGSGSYTIIALVAEPERRATYTGVLGAVYGAASVLGPLIGGVFSTTTTWRWSFYINLPIGAVSVFVIVFFLKMPKSAKPQQASWREKLLQLDLIGTVLLMGAIVTYLLAIHYGGQINPWSSSLVIGLLVGMGLLFITFAANEYWQGERAMVVPRLIARRDLMLSAIYSTLLPGAFFAMIYYMPIYFQAIRGSSALISGAQNLPFIVSAMIGALSAGAFISKTGRHKIVMLLGAALGAIGCGLCYTFDENTPIGNWVGYQLIAGVGLGGSFQVPVIIGQAIAGPEDLSTTTSMLLGFQTVGAALFVSAAQAAFVNTLLVSLSTLAPGVDKAQVVATGAGQLRSVFSAHDLPGILASYLDGLQVTYLLEVGLIGTSFLLALGMP